MLKRLHRPLAILFVAGFIADPASADDVQRSEILARTVVPNSMIPQAEIRLVRRGEETIVQSAIWPSFPGKVLKKITRSEKKNWPGDANAEAYIAALKMAFDIYEKQHDRKTTALVIDFTSAGDHTRVDFYFAAASRSDSGIRIQSAAAWKSLKLSPGYVEKNQEYILLDAFGKEAHQHIRTLRSIRNHSDANTDSST